MYREIKSWIFFHDLILKKKVSRFKIHDLNPRFRFRPLSQVGVCQWATRVAWRSVSASGCVPSRRAPCAKHFLPPGRPKRPREAERGPRSAGPAACPRRAPAWVWRRSGVSASRPGPWRALAPGAGTSRSAGPWRAGKMPAPGRRGGLPASPGGPGGQLRQCALSLPG